MTVNSLGELIKVNDNFKNAINLYLNLNKTDKILSYIPTKSSVTILDDYINNVNKNKEQASILIGPYGKGKSHLLLILLAILTLERNEENFEVIKKVIDKIRNVDETTADNILNLWKHKKRFLPVIISNSYTDLNQSFLLGINEALKRENLTDLVPETYFSAAIEVINNWKKNYKETFEALKNKLQENDITCKKLVLNLKSYDKDSLDLFIKIYPQLTSGSKFNPMVNTGILPLYKSINEKLCEEYSYSGIYIIFDEFSKYIESLNNKSAGNEMKLLQEICELAEESKENAQLFITMVTHKSIKEYGDYLSTKIINSFLGIEGRITEKYFVTSSKNNYELIENAIIKKDGYTEVEQLKDYFSDAEGSRYYNITAFNTIFKYDDFKKIIWKGCYPLNPISAYLLLNISEKVAQNERTLFTFISKDESKSMARYIKTHTDDMPWIIRGEKIYDYFKNIFKKDVSNSFIHSQWLKADYALSKAHTADEKNVLKSLALINIVNKKEEMPATKSVLSLCTQQDNIDEVIDELVRRGLIYLKTSDNCYYFKTRAVVDLKKEIKKRREKNKDFNVNEVLQKVYNKKFEVPKQFNQDYSMTRYFRYEFIDYDTFLSFDDSAVLFEKEHFCDGKILMLVCDSKGKLNQNEILKKLEMLKEEKIIVIKPSVHMDLFKEIQDYYILQQLKSDTKFIEENKILGKEIEIFEGEIVEQIIEYINNAYNIEKKAKAYYYSNNKSEIRNSNINRLVSSICRNVYNQTPIINNELINRKNLNTSPIKKARKAIIDYNLSHKNDESFYKGTSPEATIYRCLFVRNKVIEGQATGGLKRVLDEMQNFILSCSDEKKSLSCLIKKLTQPPYGMRQGVIPVYFSYILAPKVKDAVVYFGNKEVIITSDIVVNMCIHPEDYFLLITPESKEKEQYLYTLMTIFEVEKSYNLSGSKLNDIVSSMQRWFRSLPQYTRSFRKNIYVNCDDRLFKALILFKQLLQKNEVNPYEVLFVKMPKACNDNMDFQDTANKIIQIKFILDNLMYDVIKNTSKSIVKIFKANSKLDLHHALKEWYENQSEYSKNGILGNVENEFLNYVKQMTTYDDLEITKNIVKIVTNVYIENWNDYSFDDFKEKIIKIKNRIENASDNEDELKNKRVVSFIDSTGEKVVEYYEESEDSDDNSSVMENILEDTFEDFANIDVNEKINVLVHILEKVLKNQL